MTGDDSVCVQQAANERRTVFLLPLLGELFADLDGQATFECARLDSLPATNGRAGEDSIQLVRRE